MARLSLRFSIIIPALNEEAYITASVKAAQEQDFADSFEIIVVNNNSVDRTAAVAKELGVKVVNESRVGLPSAREAGRRAAKGEFLVYVDADTMLPKNYLTVIDKTFKKYPKTVGISNPFEFYDGAPADQFVIKLFFGFAYPAQNLILKLMGKSHQLLGGSFAVRAHILEELGGFDISITFSGEDLAISKSLARYGDITILQTVRSYTSARRFQTHGRIRTCAVYTKSFFSVLLLRKDSDGTLLRSLLKLMLFVAVTSFLLRHFHPNRHTMHHLYSYGRWILTALAAIAAYGIFYPKSKLFGPTISEFNTSAKIIALTFDDGPRPGSTEKVLKILKDNDVPATFFLVGEHVQKYPALAKRIHKEGHEIGNHTWNHRWLFPFHSPSTIYEQIRHTQHEITTVFGGKDPNTFHLIRPPHGWRTPWMLAELQRRGFKVVMWSVSIDFVNGVTMEQVIKRYITKTRAGSILLMHDAIYEKPSDNRNVMLEALPVIIKELKAQGYRFVRVGDML